MIIAMPTNDEINIADAFDEAVSITFFEIDKDYRITDKKSIESAEYNNLRAALLVDEATDIVFCNNVTPETAEVLDIFGITVCTSVEGTMEDAIEAFCNGTIKYTVANASFSEDCSTCTKENCSSCNSKFN